VDHGEPLGLAGRVALEPPDAVGEHRRRVEQQIQQLVHTGEGGGDGAAVDGPRERGGGRRVVDRVQPGHGGAELGHHPVAEVVLLHEAQHAPGHRLAGDGGGQEERAAQDRLVGADVVHVRHRHTGRLGRVADRRFARPRRAAGWRRWGSW
jgi:hypothetical protein